MAKTSAGSSSFVKGDKLEAPDFNDAPCIYIYICFLLYMQMEILPNLIFCLFILHN